MTFKVSKWINFNAKMGKKIGQNRKQPWNECQSKWINFDAKRAKNLGKIGSSHDFQSKWINFGAKKGKKFGQI